MIWEVSVLFCYPSKLMKPNTSNDIHLLNTQGRTKQHLTPAQCIALYRIHLYYNEVLQICCLYIRVNRSYVFRAQSQEIKERGGNQSTGIDFFITQERVIFLDTQVRMKCGYSHGFSFVCCIIFILLSV